MYTSVAAPSYRTPMDQTNGHQATFKAVEESEATPPTLGPRRANWSLESWVNWIVLGFHLKWGRLCVSIVILKHRIFKHRRKQPTIFWRALKGLSQRAFRLGIDLSLGQILQFIWKTVSYFEGISEFCEFEVWFACWGATDSGSQGSMTILPIFTMK